MEMSGSRRVQWLILGVGTNKDMYDGAKTRVRAVGNMEISRS